MNLSLCRCNWRQASRKGLGPESDAHGFCAGVPGGKHPEKVSDQSLTCMAPLQVYLVASIMQLAARRAGMEQSLADLREVREAVR